MRYIEEGKKSAKLITGGNQKGDKGYFIEPTIFVDPSPDSKVLREEIFGPVLVIQTFKTEQEAIELANDTEYGLSCKLILPLLFNIHGRALTEDIAAIYTENISRALRVASKIESGTVGINSAFRPDKSTAFGGYKQSGNGTRESGKYGLHDFMQAKTIHIKLK